MPDVYASVADLAAAIGGGSTEGIEERLVTAIAVASAWVARRVGATVVSEDMTAPYAAEDLTVVDCPAEYRAATIVVATRVYKAVDVPFGVLQTGEYGITVRTRIPEADIILFGHRTWGIA